MSLRMSLHTPIKLGLQPNALLSLHFRCKMDQSKSMQTTKKHWKLENHTSILAESLYEQ